MNEEESCENFTSVSLVKKDASCVECKIAGLVSFGMRSYILGIDLEGCYRLGRTRDAKPPESEGSLSVDEIDTTGINILSRSCPPTAFLAAVLTVIEIDLFRDQ